jgi:hypothetical protein
MLAYQDGTACSDEIREGLTDDEGPDRGGYSPLLDLRRHGTPPTTPAPEYTYLLEHMRGFIEAAAQDLGYLPPSPRNEAA